MPLGKPIHDGLILFDKTYRANISELETMINRQSKSDPPLNIYVIAAAELCFEFHLIRFSSVILFMVTVYQWSDSKVVP